MIYLEKQKYNKNINDNEVIS